MRRRLPVGAEVQAGGGVHFRVWAPRRKQVRVHVSSPGSARPATILPLVAEEQGYYSAMAPQAGAGDRYGFLLDDDPKVYPDPASRWQPDGPHEPSAVVDPARFAWGDQAWRGATLPGQVIYELHIGTFTPEGTWSAAAEKLSHLKTLGVTLVELLPIADFAGEFGWGYDGVNLFAPTRLYGTPDELRAFVDRAHALGLGVILDVVYNHFGPVGNYLAQYSADYLTDRHHTGWGEAINFDSHNSGPVREFFLANAGYWVDEYHIDGLRIDAVHAIVDDSPEHVLQAISKRVRQAAAGRGTLIFAENERQQAHLMRPVDQKGYGLDGAWNDDFHHVARVAATGHAEYYFGDYQGTPQEFISAIKWGYLYQGQWNARQKRRRGSPSLDLPSAAFVNFLQNHDQVGNSPGSCRAHQMTSPGRHRALTALLCLAPGTPMLFQGEEFSASSPFFYFADHDPDLGKLVREGRHREIRNFRRQAGADAVEQFADPGDRQTFDRCKLNWNELQEQQSTFRLHQDLLRLRREDPVFAAQAADRMHGAVIAGEGFVLRFFGAQGDDRLMLVNLGRDLEWAPMTEPLLVAPSGRQWQLIWSSEDPRYGGPGTPAWDDEHWFLPGHAAVVFAARAS